MKMSRSASCTSTACVTPCEMRIGLLLDPAEFGSATTTGMGLLDGESNWFRGMPLGVEEREGSWLRDFSGGRIVACPTSNEGVEEGGRGTKEKEEEGVVLIALIVGEGEKLEGVGLFDVVAGNELNEALADWEKLAEFVCELGEALGEELKEREAEKEGEEEGDGQGDGQGQGQGVEEKEGVADLVEDSDMEGEREGPTYNSAIKVN